MEQRKSKRIMKITRNIKPAGGNFDYQLEPT